MKILTLKEANEKQIYPYCRVCQRHIDTGKIVIMSDELGDDFPIFTAHERCFDTLFTKILHSYL